MRVLVHETHAAAADAAAEAIATQISAAVSGRGAASLALSGGTTPRDLVRHLSACDLDWPRVRLFQVDERAVPIDDPDRNWTSLLPVADHLPDSHRHSMPVEQPDADEQYSRLLHRVIGSPVVLDVVALGLGADGHTASLVPGDPDLHAVEREARWVLPYRGHRRLTLTQPVLRAAGLQVWLVTGEAKAEALRRLVAGDSEIPATEVVNCERALVFTDRQASPSGADR